MNCNLIERIHFEILSADEEQKENQRIGLIVTTFGDFARVDQAKVFNESEIASCLNKCWVCNFVVMEKL